MYSAKKEVKQEVKEEMIRKLLQRGMSVEEVAEILELDVEFIAIAKVVRTL